jgi:hypothetical protein
MSQPPHHDPGPAARPTAADPTLKVSRPPVPGRAVRAEMASGSRATPPIRHDDPTVTLPPRGFDPRRTLEFGAPAPVKVTVAPRLRPRRHHRTWPWILAVVVALVVLGTVLLVMMLRGATIDADLVGSGRHAAPGVVASSPD